MHLKALEIQGFKSFPERTVIEFHKGVTAIIGPNGSGKSNVTDAIRWVLGEQSVRTLRGSKMEDVIFTGTQSRRAMSYAEVTMIIDNSDSKLPLEYTEIQVTRRLYRSGESEYLLNKANCRLRDVAMLFMDTGLGRDGYSIVGQGRVDDILSHRSEDRRKIFEEASGIVKFKTRKEEAERKLQSTEQNLLRINDIVLELETRLEPIAEQATTAKRFLKLRDDLKSLEIALILDQIDQHQLHLSEARLEMQLLQDDLVRENQILAEIKEQNRQTSEMSHQIESQIEKKQQDFNQISNQIGELNSQAVLCEERIHQLNVRLKTASEEEKNLGLNLDSLNQELAIRNKKAVNLNRQLEIYQSQLSEAEAQMQTVMQTLDAAEKSVEQQKTRLDQLLENLYEQRNLQNQTRGQTALVDSRRKTIAFEQRELSSDRDRLRLLCEETDAQLQQIRQAARKHDADQQAARQSLEEARAAYEALSGSLDQGKQQLQNRQYRHQTLSELEKSFEGYGEAVRRLLHQAESDPVFGQGIRGTLGSLIRVEQSYELAIETALGPAIQNIVTDHEATASRLIEHLKTTRSGRATFLPIASIRGKSLENHLLNQLAPMPGFIGIASSLVHCSEELSSILAFLLGRVVVAADLDKAIQMARKTSYACRIVTLEGDVINPGGSMTGGFNRSSNLGVLGRSREIEQLQKDISALLLSLSEQEKKLPELESDMRQQARRLAEFEKLSIENDHLRVREEARLGSYNQEIEKVITRQKSLQAEDALLQKQILQIEQEVEVGSKTIIDMEQEIARIRQAVSAQEGMNRAEQARRDDLRESISDLRVSLHSVEESVQAAQEMAARIEQEKLGHQQRLERHQLDQVSGREEIARLAAELAGIQIKAADKQTDSQNCIAEIQNLNEQKNQLEARQIDFFERLEQATGRVASLQGEISRAEAKSLRYESQMDDVKNRLWEEYELTADQAAPWRRVLENRPETTRQVVQLKNEIRLLGPVNIAAIEESQAIQERYQFLTGQRDDIEAARKKLNSVIEELAAAMKLQFVEHFQRINENFKLVFAELFGGGMAEVILEDDQDVLACGIEIKAQPPGKKLQNLMLLSGGERCLTAIALLFAILKLRPTPFCVLDEVEAALDDANVSRFTEYIRRYAEDSQFILVTHRKGTMEAADMLYGVTMQERGISRILSMQLSE